MKATRLFSVILGMVAMVPTGSAQTLFWYPQTGNQGAGGTGDWFGRKDWRPSLSNAAGQTDWTPNNGTVTAIFEGLAGTVTLNNTGAYSTAGITVNTTGYAFNSSTGDARSISGNWTIGASAVTFNGTANLTVSGGIAGAGGSVNKSGGSTLTLTGNTTFTGPTTVSGGTMVLAATSGQALGGTSGITVGSGATLRLGASNQIANSASLALTGGTFAANGQSESLGALTLNGASVLDLSGTSNLTLASFTYTSGTLAIWNWSAADSILFSNSSGWTQSALNSVTFFTGSGTGAIGTATLDGNNLIPIPEVGTGLAAVALLGFVFGRRRQRGKDPASLVG